MGLSKKGYLMPYIFLQYLPFTPILIVWTFLVLDSNNWEKGSSMEIVRANGSKGGGWEAACLSSICGARSGSWEMKGWRLRREQRKRDYKLWILCH